MGRYWDDFLCHSEMDEDDEYLEHFGILGMKWGIRRYQNPDGSLTDEGREHYGYSLQKTQSKIEGNNQKISSIRSKNAVRMKANEQKANEFRAKAGKYSAKANRAMYRQLQGKGPGLFGAYAEKKYGKYMGKAEKFEGKNAKIESKINKLEKKNAKLEKKQEKLNEILGTKMSDLNKQSPKIKAGGKDVFIYKDSEKARSNATALSKNYSEIEKKSRQTVINSIEADRKKYGGDFINNMSPAEVKRKLHPIGSSADDHGSSIDYSLSDTDNLLEGVYTVHNDPSSKRIDPHVEFND